MKNQAAGIQMKLTKNLKITGRKTQKPTKMIYIDKQVTVNQTTCEAFNGHFCIVFNRDESVLQVTKVFRNVICFDDIPFPVKVVLQNIIQIKKGSNFVDEVQPDFLITAATFRSIVF